MGALCGSWVLLLICCLSVPTRDFNFSTTTLGNGEVLELGMFGWCLRGANGTAGLCSPTSVGYHLNVTTLPHYSANPGALVNITEKPLTAALIFYPLAVGSTSLANLLSLVPVRIVTMMALGMTFLSVGATVIAFAIALVVYTRANSLLQISFSPNTYVQPKLGNCLWFTAAALLCITGSFLFLLVALEPKASSKKDESVLTTAVYGANYDGVTESKFARELEREKSRSGRSRAAQAGREDRRIDDERRSIDSRRSAGYYEKYDDRRSSRRGSERGGGRRYRDEEEYSYTDEEEEVRRPPRAARRAESLSGRSQGSRKRVSKYEEEEEEETETEEEPIKRKKSAGSRSQGGSRKSGRSSSRRGEEEEDGYVDFAGRRF
ncbi:hypothetical protein T439DRAFT_329083 [Meredithblackwellia eburnea MCA 4105]